jgi:hypothetical protein
VGRLLRVSALALALASASACGPSNVELEAAPPEIVAIAADYEQPTGTVPDDRAQAVEELQQKLDTLSQTRLAEVVTSVLESLERRLDGNGLSPDPASTPKSNHAKVDAGVRVDRICRGWDDASTTPDPATNGTIQLQAKQRAGVLDRALWGTASACRGQIEVTPGAVVHLYLDGALGLLLYGPLPKTPAEARFLMTWDGTLGTERAQTSVAFDFRVLYPEVEVRLAVPDGHIIGSVGPNGVALRGHNGTFQAEVGGGR